MLSLSSALSRTGAAGRKKIGKCVSCYYELVEYRKERASSRDNDFEENLEEYDRKEDQVRKIIRTCERILEAILKEHSLKRRSCAPNLNQPIIIEIGARDHVTQ